MVARGAETEVRSDEVAVRYRSVEEKRNGERDATKQNQPEGVSARQTLFIVQRSGESEKHTK